MVSRGKPDRRVFELKSCVRLLFWIGQSFAAQGPAPEGNFKAAERRHTDVADVDTEAPTRWLAEAREVPLDCRNIVRRKGRLERL